MAVVALVAGGAIVSAPSAPADTVGSNFEGLTLGPVDSQDGWSSLGAAGSGCAVYDHAVADNSLFTNDPASFGTRSLRVSNAVTSGCFGDQTFSKKTVDEAGEPGATAGPFASGTRQSSYTGQFTFVPTVATPQPGLSVVASPDRGDGARMSWVQVTDTGGAGLDLNFIDYRDLAPFGSVGNPSDGCDGLDDFATTAVATGISRTAPHTVKVVMSFVPGARNDVVKVYLDNVLVHTGTSWEDYFRYCELTNQFDPDSGTLTSRTVRSLLFRTGGAAVPAVAGQGFLFDAVSSATAPIPVPVVSVGNLAVAEGNSGTTAANVPVTLSTSYPYPVTIKYATAVGTAKTPEDFPMKSGTVTIPANTTAATIPLGVYGGVVLEQNEAFTVAISQPTNATLGTATGTVTIRNDELPTVIVKTVKAKEGQVNAATITLKQPYAFTLNLAVKTVNGTAAAPSDFTAVNTVIPFPSQNQGPKNQFVVIKKDGLKEGVQSFTLQVTGGSAAVNQTIKIGGNKT